MSFTTPDAEKRRRALFDAALQLPERERIPYVHREAGSDTSLRESVLRLLAASRAESDGVLDRPVHSRPAARVAVPPEVIGGYEVIRRLGAGGMGTVYACRETSREKTVAVKVLHDHLQNRQFLQRFEEERAIQSRLDHPNVCRLLDAGIAQDGAPYLVMELVEGEPIDIYCRRSEGSVERQLRIFSQVLAGVEYFHREQIIHRDLKPSNVLVTAGAMVKILDFGIAKIVDHRPGVTGHGPTLTKMPLMTVRYASPEQLQQRVSGRSSDIYALGLLLFDVLTNRHPFETECTQGPTALLGAMSSRSPLPPGGIASTGNSRSVDALILKALQFDPARRYASTGQFLNDLRACLENPEIRHLYLRCP